MDVYIDSKNWTYFITSRKKKKKAQTLWTSAHHIACHNIYSPVKLGSWPAEGLVEVVVVVGGTDPLSPSIKPVVHLDSNSHKIKAITRHYHRQKLIYSAINSEMSFLPFLNVSHLTGFTIKVLKLARSKKARSFISPHLTLTICLIRYTAFPMKLSSHW